MMKDERGRSELIPSNFIFTRYYSRNIMVYCVYVFGPDATALSLDQSIYS